MSRRILALDLATKCGYAYRGLGGVVYFGTWKFANNARDTQGLRWVRFVAALDILRTSYNFDTIVYERVDFGVTTAATQVWGGFLAVVQLYCEKKSIAYSGVPVGTLKKHATGRGNAGKAEMVKYAKLQGWAVLDDNQADACHLLDYAERQLRKSWCGH